MTELPPEPVVDAARAVRERVGERAAPLLALVLGSGLGGIADALEGARRIPYREIPHFPATSVRGHRGELAFGALEGAELLVFGGRLHQYEGHSAAEVAFPVRLAHSLGARTLIVVNAAGGIRRAFRPGDLMVIRDQINLMSGSPIAGLDRRGGPRNPTMAGAYDPALADLLVRAAAAARVPVVAGVYAGVPGPSYETPGEIRMLERFGADAVAMSIIQEVIAARALGMRTGGMSCIANPAAGIAGRPLDHSEVIRVAAGAAAGVERVIRGVVKALSGEADCREVVAG